LESVQSVRKEKKGDNLFGDRKSSRSLSRGLSRTEWGKKEKGRLVKSYTGVIFKVTEVKRRSLGQRK